MILTQKNDLIEESDLIRKYNDDVKRLTSILNSIIESGEYTMLIESFENEDVLEYGIIGQKMKKTKFDNLNGENLGEFMCKVIYKVAPTSVFNFMNVNAFGNIHSSVVVDLTDRVEFIITNNNHKYDEFIFKLEESMKNNEDASKKADGEGEFVLSKKIKKF